MKNTNKFLNAAVVAVIALSTATNLSAAFQFPSKQPARQTSAGGGFSFQTPQQAPQQPQKNLNWNSMEFKDYFQVIKESYETIKMLSDKVAALEDTTKAMQATIDTLKDTVSQNYSTTIKMLNEALKK